MGEGKEWNVIRRGKGLFRRVIGMLLGPEEQGVFYRDRKSVV